MLAKPVNEKQYCAILHNCTKNSTSIFDDEYTLIYSDDKCIDNDTIDDLMVDTICQFTNDEIDLSTIDDNKLGEYYSLFNSMRVFFDTDNVYFDNDTDFFICDFETLLFIDNDIFVSDNIKIECKSKFKYQDKTITVCSVFNTELSVYLPVYKFIIIGKRVCGKYHHFEIFSKPLNINSKYQLMAVLEKQAIENAKNIAGAMNQYSLFDKKIHMLLYATLGAFNVNL